jgi:hypothetical protein
MKKRFKLVKDVLIQNEHKTLTVNTETQEKYDFQLTYQERLKFSFKFFITQSYRSL